MRLGELAATSNEVGSTRSRLAKIEAIARTLRALEADEIPVAVGLLCGSPRQGKIGLGYATVSKVRPPAAGEGTLHLREVDARLDDIKQTTGTGSTGRRKQRLGELLARCTADEQEFVRRAILGAVRQGALDGVVTEAIAKAADVPPPTVRRAAMLAGDLGRVASAALGGGTAALSAFTLEMFVPLGPMLAQPGGGLGAALDELEEAEAEFKIDGARVQVHRDGDRIEVYTRKLRPVTAAVPEIVEAVAALPLRRIVLDGEAIALHQGGAPRPFQETMRRFGRKRPDADVREAIPLTPFFFDCLVLDDDLLIDRPTTHRLEALHTSVPADIVVPHRRVTSAGEAEAFLAESLARGHEGLMLKALDAPYEAGRRGAGWRKIKPSHTLDLVVLAAEWGSGRRKGWLSNLHLGARDPSTGGFVMLGKTFKGLTDALLTWQTAELAGREVSRDEWTVYVRPELVVEIAFDGVQESPHYPGGMALRFARVKRYRADKSAAEADTIEQVRAIYTAARTE